jgi:hypothetical protein
MANVVKSMRRAWRAAHLRARELRMIAKGLASTDHPILAHIIPMRRCNLACTYCNEYDDHSKPVPLETVCQRIDLLAALGTTIVTISGGEPLLHPDLDEIVAHIRRRRAIAGMITNGYLLTAERIQRLNRAGLEHLQISIDNVMPDDVSKKSLKVLDKKAPASGRTRRFSREYQFRGGRRHSQSAGCAGGRQARRGAGFHFDGGHHSRRHRAVAAAVPRGARGVRGHARHGKSSYAQFNYFQDNIAHGKENHWRCRAGARYLYICEDGWCTIVRSSAGIRPSRSGASS